MEGKLRVDELVKKIVERGRERYAFTDMGLGGRFWVQRVLQDWVEEGWVVDVESEEWGGWNLGGQEGILSRVWDRRGKDAGEAVPIEEGVWE